MKPQYHSLKNLVSDKRTFQDLIHLGATGQLPIYALSDGWSVEVWRQEFEVVEAPLYDAEAILPIGQPHKVSPLAETVVGPVRLFTETLARYEANPSITECRFEGPEDDQVGECTHEYRLMDVVDGKPQKPIAIQACELVVMSEDMRSIPAAAHARAKRFNLPDGASTWKR